MGQLIIVTTLILAVGLFCGRWFHYKVTVASNSWKSSCSGLTQSEIIDMSYVPGFLILFFYVKKPRPKKVPVWCIFRAIYQIPKILISHYFFLNAQCSYNKPCTTTPLHDHLIQFYMEIKHQNK